MRTLNLMRRHAGKPGAVARAAVALAARGTPAKAPLTMLEAETLAYVSLRLDPWHGARGKIARLDDMAVPSGSTLGDSRRVSQALQRLVRKGFVDRFPLYNVTSSGQSALRDMFHWALVRRIHP